MPADRFFEASQDVRATLAAQVAKNALELAREGEPRKPFYLTGRVGNETISLHAEGERVVLVREDGTREEVDLGASGPRIDVSAEALEERSGECSDVDDSAGGDFYDESFAGAAHDDGHVPQHVPAPGASPLDAALHDLVQNWPEIEPPAELDAEQSVDDECSGERHGQADDDAADRAAGGRS